MQAKSRKRRVEGQASRGEPAVHVADIGRCLRSLQFWSGLFCWSLVAARCVAADLEGGQAGLGEASTNPIAFKLCSKWPSHTRGQVRGIQVIGNHAYAAVMGGGLVVYEITARGELEQKGVLPGGGGWTVCVRGHYAYVGQDRDGLAIVDIQNPEKPELVGRFSESRGVQSLQVSEELALVPGTEGVLLVDVGSPASPRKLGEIKTEDGVGGVDLRGAYAYVASRSRGLQIWDCREPGRPVHAGTFKTQGLAIGVAVCGNLAYLLEGTDTLHIVDISEPSKPALLGSLKAVEGYYSHWDRIWVSGKYAYLGGYGDLDVVDVSEPQHPRLAKSLKRVGAGAIGGAGNWLVAGGFGTLRTYDISRPENPVARGSLSMFGYANDVQIRGRYAFLADGGGLQVLDISNPKAPLAVTKAKTHGFAESVRLRGKYAFVVDSYCPDGPTISEEVPSFGLQIFDISEPTRLVKMNHSSVATHNHFTRVAVAEGWAYLLEQWLTPVDLQDLSEPRVRVLPGERRGSAYSDIYSLSNHLYAVGPEGLHILELGTPAQPQLVGTYPTVLKNKHSYLNPILLAMAWPYAYLADVFLAGGEGHLDIVDIRTATRPRLVGQCQLAGRVMSIDVSGNKLVAADEEGVKAFDVSNPEHPVMVGQCMLPGSRKSVRVAGNFVYVGSWTELIVLEMEPRGRLSPANEGNKEKQRNSF